MSFKIKKVTGGYALFWKGRAWPMEPRETEEEAQAYAGRVTRRYPSDTIEWFIDSKEEEQKRTRGGPWRYTLADGTTEVLMVERKSDAEALLRRKLNRKRLPSGIAWEIDQWR